MSINGRLLGNCGVTGATPWSLVTQHLKGKLVPDMLDYTGQS